MNTIKSKLVDACIVVTITLALLAGLEIAARLVNQVKEMASPSTVASLEDAILLKQNYYYLKVTRLGPRRADVG